MRQKIQQWVETKQKSPNTDIVIKISETAQEDLAFLENKFGNIAAPMFAKLFGLPEDLSLRDVLRKIIEKGWNPYILVAKEKDSAVVDETFCIFSRAPGGKFCTSSWSRAGMDGEYVPENMRFDLEKKTVTVAVQMDENFENPHLEKNHLSAEQQTLLAKMLKFVNEKTRKLKPTVYCYINDHRPDFITHVGEDNMFIRETQYHMSNLYVREMPGREAYKKILEVQPGHAISPLPPNDAGLRIFQDLSI